MQDTREITVDRKRMQPIEISELARVDGGGWSFRRFSYADNNDLICYPDPVGGGGPGVRAE